MSYSTAISMAQSVIANLQMVGQTHLADAASRVIRPVFKSTSGKMLLSFALGFCVSKALAKMLIKPAAKEEPAVLGTPLKLTLPELAAFNGKDNKPAYTALNGKIYDLTSCPLSKDDAILRLIAGCDAGPLLQKTFKSMGICNLNSMHHWKLMLESECPFVGYLIEHIDFDGQSSNQTESEDGSSVVDSAEQIE